MSFFFFNDTATTEIYTLSLHDALPILPNDLDESQRLRLEQADDRQADFEPEVAHRGSGHLRPQRWPGVDRDQDRSEEHTSELQSRQYLVCRLLLEKKKTFLPLILTNSI